MLQLLGRQATQAGRHQGVYNDLEISTKHQEIHSRLPIGIGDATVGAGIEHGSWAAWPSDQPTTSGMKNVFRASVDARIASHGTPFASDTIRTINAFHAGQSLSCADLDHAAAFQRSRG